MRLMALNAVFDPILSRVRLTGTLLDDGATALFERSRNNLYWTTVRGGSAVTIDGSDEAALDDYEFVPGVINYYRVTAGADVFTTTITPNQSGVWLKSITRPFLNRPVSVVELSDITRPARVGVFEIKGSSFPIAVSDVRGSRRWTMTVKSDSVVDADALELVFASGEPLYIQTDGQNDIPGGYVVVGDVPRRRFGKTSERRWFDLPCTEVAAPGPSIVGRTSTWETLVAEFGSWNAVLAEFGTWAEVVDYVADPSVVIVP
jgi:hypothetical protein